MFDEIKNKLKKFNSYEEENLLLVNDDCFKVLKKMPKNSVDVIFADPPYFLSNNGITCSNGKMVSVNKGKWDDGFSVKEKNNFNKKWIKLCKEVLNDSGSIWISGTMHNIYSIGLALEENGFKIINNVTWYKPNAAPNLACKMLTHSTETILWAKKDIKNIKHHFDYNEMKKYNDNKQLRDVWNIPTTPKREKLHGKHPTQKPEKLLQMILECSTKENFIVMDPFSGSSTSGVVAKKMGLKFIGIEKEEDFFELSKKRFVQCYK